MKTGTSDDKDGDVEDDGDARMDRTGTDAGKDVKSPPETMKWEDPRSGHAIETADGGTAEGDIVGRTNFQVSPVSKIPTDAEARTDGSSRQEA